jgi:hypothetical protein
VADRINKHIIIIIIAMFYDLEYEEITDEIIEQFENSGN